MTSIGIIANPASGKDIRRLVSYATVIDNNEKVNIVTRIILAAQGMGIDTILCMPDTFLIAERVIDSLSREKVLTASIEVLAMPINGSAADSTLAAEMMRAAGVGCVVSLGGAGTSRAVAKTIGNTPLLPVSTGTNNVYPSMLEGTSVGIAAAVVARIPDPLSCCVHDKRIEVSINDGEKTDIALIDAVVVDAVCVGAKAIWDCSEIRRLVVSRCHPACIGFSSIAGCIEPVGVEDDHGYTITLSTRGRRVQAPIAAGVIAELYVTEHRRLALAEGLRFRAEDAGMIALDGEREIRFKAGDILTFTVTRNGPFRVDMDCTMVRAVQNGHFQ
ncbi:MAG: NAD(+)/NADH kinase [Planctomycetaceae bacterium]|nr:NAD(+)/NADH kinase [Planctomycetaceae bacterium]